MAFDGSGNFNLSYNWVDDYNLDILIDPTRMMGQENDIASGLSLCITRDGQGVPSANISWNNFRITSLGDAVLDGDAVSRSYADSRYMQIGGAADPRYFFRDGSLSMTGNIDFGNNRATNMASGVNGSDGVTVAQLSAATGVSNYSAIQLIATTITVQSLGGF